MMRTLGDLALTDVEVRGFRRMLKAHITQADIDEEITKRTGETERNERYYDALVLLAADTAHKDGLTTFWRRGQAAASWEAFCASESYYSPLDVDEYFEPDGDWQETWELAYQRELEAMYKTKER